MTFRNGAREGAESPNAVTLVAHGDSDDPSSQGKGYDIPVCAHGVALRVEEEMRSMRSRGGGNVAPSGSVEV